MEQSMRLSKRLDCGFPFKTPPKARGSSSLRHAKPRLCPSVHGGDRHVSRHAAMPEARRLKSRDSGPAPKIACLETGNGTPKIEGLPKFPLNTTRKEILTQRHTHTCTQW